MILRKLTIFNFVAMVVVCAFQVALGIGDICNCACLELSLSGKSVCQHLSIVLNELERRKDYITQLETRNAGMNLLFEEMNARMETFEEKIRKLTSSPVPAVMISGPKMMEDLNEKWHSIKSLENKLQNVTSFDEGLGIEEWINSKLEDMKETLFENDINELHNKFEGVVYRNDTKKLNERLDSVEKNLSDLTNSKSVSRMSTQINNFRKALENINETLYQNMRAEMLRQSVLDVHSYRINNLENIEEQVRFLSSSTSVLQDGLVDLHYMIQDNENKTERAVKTLVDLAIRSSLNASQKVTDQVKQIETEWTSNCSEGRTSCVPLQSNRTPLSSYPTLKNSLNNVNIYTDERKRKMQDRLFWGCAEISPDDFPNLVLIRRNSDKKLMFSCAKHTRLIGSRYTQCQQGLWKPDTPPICVSRSTHPSIPECREIKTDNDPSLLLIIKDVTKVLFQCSDGKLLKGPSFIRCTKGLWVPNSVPECVYP